MAYDRKEQKVSMDDAISRLAGVELASPNRYWVAFNLPQGLVAQGANDNLDGVASPVLRGKPVAYQKELGDIGIMCSQMSFPGRALDTVDSRHIGTPYRLPIAANYTDVDFTFTLSADMRERKFFEIWQQTIINVHMNSLNFYDEYIMPVHLMQLDKQGQVTYQTTLIEAYPIAVGEVQNSFASNNEVSTCTVTMAYRHWINQDLK